jgi:hypothetical protein
MAKLPQLLLGFQNAAARRIAANIAKLQVLHRAMVKSHRFGLLTNQL